MALFELWRSGTLIYSSDDIAGRAVYQTLINGAGSHTSAEYGAAGRTVFTHFSATTNDSTPPTISRSGNTVSWSAATGYLLIGVI